MTTTSNYGNVPCCDICFVEYNDGDRCPKMLACGHTACLSCLTQLPRTGLSIDCHICRTTMTLPSKGIEGLPSNFALLDMITPRISITQTQTTTLQTQTTNPTTVPDLQCSTHTLKAVTHFCFKCMQKLCSQCRTARGYNSQHKSHNVQDINTVYELIPRVCGDEQTDLRECKARLRATRDDMKRAIAENLKQEKRKIHNQVKSIRAQLKQWAESKVLDVESEAALNRSTIDEESEQVSKDLTAVMHNLLTVRKQVSQGEMTDETLQMFVDQTDIIVPRIKSSVQNFEQNVSDKQAHLGLE